MSGGRLETLFNQLHSLAETAADVGCERQLERVRMQQWPRTPGGCSPDETLTGKMKVAAPPAAVLAPDWQMEDGRRRSRNHRY